MGGEAVLGDNVHDTEGRKLYSVVAWCVSVLACVRKVWGVCC